MRGDVLVLFPDLVLDKRQVILLIVVGDALACHVIGIPSLRECCIVQLTAPGERPEELLLSGLVRVEAIFVRLSQVIFLPSERIDLMPKQAHC